MVNSGRAQQWLLDARLPVVLLVPAILGTRGASEPEGFSRPAFLAYALVVVAVLALVPRRQIPGIAMALNVAAVAAYLALSYPFGPILLTLPFCTYAVGHSWPIRRALTAAAGVLAVLSGALVVRSLGDSDLGDWQQVTVIGLAWIAILSAPLAVGSAVRVRQESTARMRAEQARRAVSEEQLRMAQELHDVVGHGLAVIAMQAGVALHVLDRDPRQARESLEAIRSTSRDALDSLRAEIAQLRAPLDGAVRRPQPGLGDVQTLVQRVRAGGLDISLEVAVADDGVAPEVAAAAYRIVQESLSNVLRHAHAQQACVRVDVDGSELRVLVSDSGAAPVSAVREGNGITGMRARAEALGGALTAGPEPGGGFAVRARLPLHVGQPR